MRNLEHLEYDQNLYEFMFELSPFTIQTSNKVRFKILFFENIRK
jgi:hypothetical protein